MINKSKFSRVLSLGIAVAVLILMTGHFNQSFAQKDPFAKPGWAVPKKQSTVSKGGTVKPPTPAVVPVNAPAIEQRIEYYKQLREQAVANDLPIPKVTSVLTLGEMLVTGIFKTPRGYAAMVEATPIKLSYTIYPGEKFFDGQLVAIEENRLIFRKVMKMSNGKFIASVENKALRQYTTQELVQGTAPVQGERPMETAVNVMPPPVETKAAPSTIVSPLDEMNNSPEDENGSPSTKGKPGTKAPAKRPVKVAKTGTRVNHE